MKPSPQLILDEITLHCLSFEAIDKLFEYEDQFLALMVQYNTININNRRKVQGKVTILNKDLGISARNMLRYLRSAKIIP